MNIINWILEVIGKAFVCAKMGLPRWVPIVPVWGTWKICQRVSRSRGWAVVVVAFEVAISVVMWSIIGFAAIMSRRTESLMAEYGLVVLVATGLLFVLILASLGVSIAFALDLSDAFDCNRWVVALVVLLAPAAYLYLGLDERPYLGPAGNPLLADEEWREMPSVMSIGYPAQPYQQQPYGQPYGQPYQQPSPQQQAYGQPYQQGMPSQGTGQYPPDGRGGSSGGRMTI